MRMRSLISSAAMLVLFCGSVVTIHTPGWSAEGGAVGDLSGGDFALQGEYEGEAQLDDGPAKVGAQVLALGGGKFSVFGYPGGLPGNGWNRGDEIHEHENVTAENGVIKFSAGSMDVVVDGETFEIKANGGSFATLKKVERKSPTLGAEPPKSAIVLFDGSSVDHWNNGKLVEGKWLGATNCETKQKLCDHTLHIEFRTPYMPAARGQGRGNSGVYVQSRYEVQVLDSFGLEGKDNECGGIYSINRPIVNMCLPPLAWQTYDIDFTAARYDESGKKVKNGRITIKHNGVVIHDDQELAHGTPGRRAEGPGPDALFLQDHGNPVVFRNVWVVEK
ncbi:MAG: DUF1080 domain-containing protein [Planctomycetales bacterium]|nr:DUF1080 domain-containing protein [Planctomycetales bacterium]